MENKIDIEETAIGEFLTINGDKAAMIYKCHKHPYKNCIVAYVVDIKDEYKNIFPIENTTIEGEKIPYLFVEKKFIKVDELEAGLEDFKK